MLDQLRAVCWAVWIRVLRSVGPVLPANRLRCWALAAQGYAVGKGVYIGERLLVSDELEADDGRRLSIGDRASIAQNVTIVVSSHPNNSRLAPVFGHKWEPVVLEDDVWVGAGAIILPGITVGREAVIGAGAVVTRSIPARSVAVGNPARISRSIPDPS